MSTNKETGSYYTPYDLVEFMVKYLKRQGQDFSNVLEPSAGDGRFLSWLLPVSGHLKAIELFANKVAEIRDKYVFQENLQVEQNDFIEYAMNSEEKYSLIIGNPPYINIKLMKKEELELAKEMCEEEGLRTSIMQNMWLAFVVGAMRLLKMEGSIFFVLPMEFLQVQYAEKLREHLEKKFNTIHIISFRKQIFSEIEQEVCLVYLTNRARSIPYILYEIYEDAISEKPVYINKIQKSKPLKKWSNAILSDEEINLLKDVSEEYEKVNMIGDTAPGIVTGGNKYFILTQEQVQEYECQEYTIPILQKSSFVNENTVIIDEHTMNGLQRRQKPMYLLDLADVQEVEMSARLLAYLNKIREEKTGDIRLIDRYKCANRSPWYGVPIVKKGGVIFFKRYHVLPRVYINRANIHTTDAGYHIRLKEGLDKDSVVFCFYNSLTLAQCEFQGRYYGGGVSELVTSEFKALPIPYSKIEREDIEKLDRMFREKNQVEEIVSFVNSKTLMLDMEENTVIDIENIRRKLVKRRL